MSPALPKGPGLIRKEERGEDRGPGDKIRR